MRMSVLQGYLQKHGKLIAFLLGLHSAAGGGSSLLSLTIAAEQCTGPPQGHSAAAKPTWREFKGPAAGLRAAVRGTSPELVSSRYRT
jgi:hypothetical protein